MIRELRVGAVRVCWQHGWGAMRLSMPVLCCWFAWWNRRRSYVHFEYLEHALQHGEMPPEAAQRVPSIHATFGSDEAAAAFFAEGMAGASLGERV